jgi:lysophospholipase L1-like esterase
MEHNYVRQPLIILTVITATLIILSFIPTQKKLPSFIKPIDVFADLKNENKSHENPIAKDMAKLKEDVAVLRKDRTSLLQDYSLQTKNSFTDFIKKLQKAQKTKVRIAYFGDSFIESDFVTHDLRQLLQKKYGGKGVGFVSITTVSAGMRKSIKHSFSSNWNVYTIQQHSSQKIGLSGYAFTPNDHSMVSYTLPLAQDSMQNVELIYGALEQPMPLQITTDHVSSTVYLPTSTAFVNSTTINTKNTHALELNCTASNTLLYGCRWEDSVGVYIDNFSFRGANGMQLMKLDTTLIQAYNQVQAYDLIVLHYGINVLGSNSNSLDWYKTGFAKTVQFVQKQFPNAAILIISASDKSTKINGEHLTDKGVEPLIAIQETIAQKNHIAFFNLYQAMGGTNSMVDWVQQKPALAEKDYTHLTFWGAQKVANLIYHSILNF